MSDQVAVSYHRGLAAVDTKKATAAILLLPLEMLLMIADKIEDPATLSIFTRVCKPFRATGLPKLYRHIIKTETAGDVLKFFFSLRPLLSPYEKKRLENSLSVQSVRAARSSISSDEDKQKPVTANHVQNLRLHVAPRDSIQYGQYSKTQWKDICHYIEAAIEVIPNLKLVETNVITE